MLKRRLFLILIAFLCSNFSFSQEVPTTKLYEYSVGINKLKTQAQADAINQKIAHVSGVKNSSLVLIDYKLVFQCTNIDMNKYTIMEIVKDIILEEGSEITTINRKILK